MLLELSCHVIILCIDVHDLCFLEGFEQINQFEELYLTGNFLSDLPDSCLGWFQLFINGFLVDFV